MLKNADVKMVNVIMSLENAIANQDGWGLCKLKIFLLKMNNNYNMYFFKDAKILVQVENMVPNVNPNVGVKMEEYVILSQESVFVNQDGLGLSAQTDVHLDFGEEVAIKRVIAIMGRHAIT